MTALVVDLFDRDHLADPAPLFRRLLAAGGPVRTADGHVVVYRHDDVRRGLGDPVGLSAAETNGAQRRRLPVLVGTDPPAHTRLRRLCSPYFNADARRRWQPAVARRVEAVAAAAVAQGRMEGVGALCAAAPRAALSELMAIDDPELAWLLDDAPSRHRAGRRQSFADFFGHRLADRTARPGDDLLSALCAARAGDDRLSEAEIVGFCILLTAAGTDSVRDLLANLFVELAAAPALWDQVAAHPDRFDAVVDEAVRYVSPVQGVFRTATADDPDREGGGGAEGGVVGGGRWSAGDRVLLLLGAANRDGSCWADPDRLLPGRYAADPPPPAHLGFGGGVHSCLGLALARIEIRAVLQCLVDAGVRPVVDGDVARARNPYFRTVRRLPLRFVPA
ncbi:MAG TPA: cytochrome P450 [Acidimicrobiales bacterium]|nr:cytochrome P450 [Acidimicrobiales bacterium]